MKKGFWLRLVIALLVISLLILVMFFVDFNLVAAGNSPKFCFNIKYNINATEYFGVGYKIIKYTVKEDEVKFKVGSLFLKYDPNFLDRFSEKVDIQGYIKEINNNSGICVIYIEKNPYSTKNYNYDKVYASILKETLIKDLDTDKILSKNDLKIGQLVNLTFVGNVQEIYPVRGTAGFLSIVQNVEDGEDLNE